MSIHGQLLDVTVVGCSKLKDTEWFSRQDPYVSLEYATTKFRTRTCTDGGRNPSFQEKTSFPLIEGLKEISVSVWNSNTVKHDNYIGTGRVLLHKVLADGYDDSSWVIQSRSGKFAGEVKLIMHYAGAGKAQKPAKAGMPASPAPMGAPPPYHTATPPMAAPPPYHTATPPYAPPSYHTATPSAPPPYHASPTQYATTYMPSKSTETSPYPPTGYPPIANPAGMHAYPPAYPPNQNYPPAAYPPAQPHHQPAPYPGVYPPPPY